MDNRKNDRRGYCLIEPPIYEEFNDMDKLIACLDLICKELPTILTDFPTSIRYTVLAVGNPFGPPYPAIGFYTDYPDDYNLISENYDFDQVVEDWLTFEKIQDLKYRTKNHSYKSWEELRRGL